MFAAAEDISDDAESDEALNDYLGDTASYFARNELPVLTIDEIEYVLQRLQQQAMRGKILLNINSIKLSITRNYLHDITCRQCKRSQIELYSDRKRMVAVVLTVIMCGNYLTKMRDD